MNEKTDSPESEKTHRVIVTVDVESNLPSTLELAAALAAAQRRALHGLFVEDVDLLSVAGLPFSQEVPLLCGRPRNLDDRALARALLRASEEFRRNLENHAQQMSVSWSFSTVRGRKQALVLGEEDEADILVVAQRSGRRPTVRKALHRVLLALDHSALALPALKVILERNLGRHIELLVMDDEDDALEDAHPELLEMLADHPDVKPVPKPKSELRELLQAREHGLDCVVASRKIEPQQIREILSLAICPVIIVS